MHSTRASGAATVVTSTTSEISHSPYSSSSTGPVTSPATRCCPAVLTDIRVSVAPSRNRISALRLSASGSSSGSRRVWRSTASQRRQTARAPGGSGGMICICPQSGHSYRRRAVVGTGRGTVAADVPSSANSAAKQCVHRSDVARHRGRKRGDDHDALGKLYQVVTATATESPADAGMAAAFPPLEVQA